MTRRALRLAATLLVALGSCAGCGREKGEALSFEPDSIPDAYARPTAALLWPNATRAFEVTPRGDLVNGEWRVQIDPETEGLAAAPPLRIASYRRWLPVVAWTRSAGQVRWRFEAVPFPEPPPRDTGLLVSLLARATNTGTAPRRAKLSVHLETLGENPAFVAFDAPERPTSRLTLGSGGGADTLEAWATDVPRGRSASWSWSLGAGESREVTLLLPAYPTPASRLAQLARAPHALRVAEARRHWEEAMGSGASFELNDAEIEDAIRAARVLLLSCRERRGRLSVPIGGPFQYRDVWLRDGARAIHALSIMGHTRESRELAAGLMLFQWPQGAFLSQRGQPDGTGQALWAFEQAFLRPTPSDSVGPFAEAALRAVRWFEWQRDFGRQSGWKFGLMLPYAEPRDGELTRAQLVGTDAWALAGYASAARLLRAAGREPEALQVDRARAVYQADFQRALELSATPDLPASWQGVGRDWGNLAAAWPCHAVEAGDPRAARLAERAWRAAGQVGLVTYAHPDSMHYYLGADLGTWALLAGQRQDAERVLEALLHWRNASGASGELFSRSGECGMNLPPHPTSAAALLALARNCLLYDDDDTLRLTLGARQAWWKGARARRAPTRWGAIDLDFHRDGERAAWLWSAVPVWTALTLPPGTVLAGPPDPPLVARGSTSVLAPPGTREARVQLTAGPPR